MARVGDIMTRSLETVSPTSPVQEAAHRMKVENVGSLPVCVESHLVGMLTDRDLTVRVTAEGRDARTTLVGQVMSEAVVILRPHDSLATAERLLQEHQVRRLPVVEDDGRLVGYVTLATVVRRESDAGIVARVLQGIFRPSLAPKAATEN